MDHLLLASAPDGRATKIARADITGAVVYSLKPEKYEGGDRCLDFTSG